MSTQNTRQNLYQSKINGLMGEINTLRMQLSGTENKVNSVDNVLSKLPSRISAIRQMNYKIQVNLEGDQLTASERWSQIGPSIKLEVSNQASILKNELSSLERDVNARRISTSFDISGLMGLDLRLNTVKVLVYNFSSRIDKDMLPLQSILAPLEQGVSVAEEVVKLTSAASYQWKEGETPVIAIHAKNMNEKTEGVLTLTNHRVIYEIEKEVVLKKTFFIVTEKKMERSTSIERPIGAVSKITKGRVGLLAGDGLYVEFKQGDIQLKLDTKGEDADRVIKFYSLIVSGQVDDELGKSTPVEHKTDEKRIVSCPKCGAPYTDEIYRGQQTVQCKYCNTLITVQ
jgi:hypothetical protein